MEISACHVGIIRLALRIYSRRCYVAWASKSNPALKISSTVTPTPTTTTHEVHVVCSHVCNIRWLSPMQRQLDHLKVLHNELHGIWKNHTFFSGRYIQKYSWLKIYACMLGTEHLSCKIRVLANPANSCAKLLLHISQHGNSINVYVSSGPSRVGKDIPLLALVDHSSLWHWL